MLMNMKKIREEYQIPVMILSAKVQLDDKILGLDLGADDYLVKPFGIMEMVSRVKAVLRRCKPKESSNLLKLDGLVLNPDEHTVTVDGERVILTYKEYELLYLFLTERNI